jgi:chorismate lyase
MLLSDGSVTRHLQLMTGQSVDVQCLEMQSIGAVDALEFPCELGNIIGDASLVRRQVFLRFPDRLPSSYVYATSWWQEDVVNMYLRCVTFIGFISLGV